nr:MAG TPA: Terminase [Caudoviricetes sp.]
METSELIRRASKRDISTYDNLSLYFDTVRLETDFEKACPHYERIYDISAQQKVKLALSDQQTAIKFYELAKKAALMLAPHLFHYYLLYVEWDREPQKKFYVPRMNVLKPVVDDLQDLADGRIELLTISLPPRVGKSTLGIFYVTWLMGREPDKANVMSGHSDKLTKGFFKECLDILSDPDYLWHDVFPKAKVVAVSSEDESISVNHKRRFPTLTCRSVTGTLTGAVEVGNLLYVDDIIEDLEEALNPQRLQNKYDAYLNQLKDRKKDGARELHIGTRWAVGDVIGRLQQQYGDDPKARFTVIPALNENGESNFDYPYGLGFSTAYYQDMKASIDPCTWSCKYMGDPYVREGLLFERDELNYYNGVLPDGECDIMSVVDVAWGGGDSLSAPIIYWFGDTGYVHDWVFSAGDKSVTQPLVCAAYARNNVARARFEANVGGTEYAEEIDKTLRERNYKMSIQSQRASTKSSKMDRIVRWSSDIKSRLVFRSDKARGEMYDKAMNELCRISVDAKKQHDDAPDSLAMAMDYRDNGLCSVKVIERRW